MSLMPVRAARKIQDPSGFARWRHGLATNMSDSMGILLDSNHKTTKNAA